MIAALSVAVLVSALLHIRAEYQGPRSQVYLFKPLTTILILAVAIAAPQPVHGYYRSAIALGLLFSLAGDVFLMLPKDRFLPGLASFFVAHVVYIVGFGSRTGFAFDGVALIPFLGVGAMMVAFLWKGFGPMRIPAIAYAIAIVVMAWQAWVQYGVAPDASSLLAVAGALLFVTSDSILAVDRFRAPFRAAQAALLLTYFSGQWLIALSVNQVSG